MARRPSLVQVVTDLQSQGRVGGGVQGPGDNGWAQAGKELSGDFKRIGDEVGRMADAAATREGAADGRGAGLDPEFRTRQDGTLYGEAFDRAGLDIAETRLKTSLEGQIDALEEQHAASPKALGKGIDGVIGGVLSGAPAELRPKLQMWAGHKRLVAMRGAQREMVARTRAEAAAAQQLELTDGIRSMQQMAFKLGLDPEADKVLGERLASLQSVVGRRGVDGKPLLDPKAAARLFTAAQESVAEGRLKGAFDRLTTPEEKASFLGTLEDDWKNGRGIAGRMDMPAYEGLRRELEGELRRATAGRSAMHQAIANQIKEVHQAAKKGIPPATEDLARLRGAAAGIPALEGELRAAENTYRFASGFRTGRPGEMSDWIAGEHARLAEQGVRPGTGEWARLELAREIASEARAELKADPMGWADKVGLIPGGAARVDTSSPAALAGSLPRVVAHAETVARYYDLEAPVYLRPDDRKRLTALAAPGGKQLLDVVEGVTAAGAAAPRVLAELAEGGGATLAAVGGLILSTGRRVPVVEDVANGVALSRTTDFKGWQVTAAGARQMAAEAHGGALAGHPEHEQALINAANYAYAVRSQGKPENRDLWKQVFRELMGERKIGTDTYGGVTQHRGRSVIVPPDVKQDEFGTLIKNLDVADFEVAPVYKDQRTVGTGTLRTAHLEPAGEGKFRMNVGEPDAPQYLQRPGGGDFILDLKALKPRLIQRVPQAYLDGEAAAPPVRRGAGGRY